MPSIFKNLKELFKPLLMQSRGSSKQIIEKALERAAGIEVQRQNPDPLLTDTGKFADLYDLMLRDDRINFAINLKKRLILSTPYSIIPASDDKEQMEHAQEIRDCLRIGGKSKYKHDFGYSFLNSLDNALDAMSYGYKVCEIIWKMSDEGKVFVSNLKFKHSMLFDFDYDDFGNLDKLLIGRNFGDQKEISPIDEIQKKFLIWTYPYAKDGNAYGDSDLREVYECYRAKKHIFRQRNIHIQNWGTPIPEVVYDSNSVSPTEKEELKELLENFQDNMYILTPGQRGVGNNGQPGELYGKFKLNIHEAKSGTNTDQFEKAIDQIDKQITRSILIPDKMGFSESPGGSYNMAEIQAGILSEVRKFMHSWIENTINPLIKMIIDFNYGVQDEYPRFEFDEVEKIDANILKTLIDSGIVDKREKWIRTHAGIPVLSEEEKEEIEDAKEEERKNSPLFNPSSGGGDQAHGGETPRKNNPPNTTPEPKKDDSEEDDDEPPVKNIITFASKKNPFNSKEVEKFFQDQENSFASEYTEIRKKIDNDLIKQIERKGIINDKNLSESNTLRIKKADLNKFFAYKMSEMFFYGKVSGIKEVSPRIGEMVKNKFRQINFQAGPEWLERDFIARFLEEYGPLGVLTRADIERLAELKDKAFFITGLEEDRILKQAKKIINQGVRAELNGAQVVSQLKGILNDDISKNAFTIARTNISDQYNVGRMNFFSDTPMKEVIEAYQYQAILDDGTTAFCAGHDGQIIEVTDPRLPSITPPNHFNALHPQTLVHMGSHKKKQIKDIEVGDFVVTHKGRLKEVYDVMLEYREEEIYEVELENGRKIFITGDHPVFVDNEGWLNADELKEGMNVVYRGNEISIRYCESCGKEIKTKGKKKNMRFCNQKCMGDSMRVLPEKKCKKCGKNMVSTWKKGYSKNRKFCSTRCYFSYKGRTSIEEVMAKTLDELNVEYVEQYKIDRYFVDFFIPSKKIVIEADGNYWHDVKEKWNKRIKRDATISSLGYLLVRIGQDDILSDKLKKELKMIIRRQDERLKDKINKEN